MVAPRPRGPGRFGEWSAPKLMGEGWTENGLCSSEHVYFRKSRHIPRPAVARRQLCGGSRLRQALEALGVFETDFLGSFKPAVQLPEAGASGCVNSLLPWMNQRAIHPRVVRP